LKNARSYPKRRRGKIAPVSPKGLETRIRLGVPASLGVGEFLADVLPTGVPAEESR
jgi:hypothetical protein